MTHRLLVTPTGHGVGLTSVCLGIARALDRLGVRYGFFKPIGHNDTGPDRSTALIRLTTHLDPPEPIGKLEAEAMLGEGREAQLLERVVSHFEIAARDADVVVIEGLVPVSDIVYATRLNVAIATALDAEVVHVCAPSSDDPIKVADNVDIAAREYGRPASCVLNKVSGNAKPLIASFAAENIALRGIIPLAPAFATPRTKELVDQIGARVVHAGHMDRRRIVDIALCASGVTHAIRKLDRGRLVITPGDREDIVLAAALASLDGAHLAGLLLTGGRLPSERVMTLCRRAFDHGLPVLAVDSGSFVTASHVSAMGREVQPDDHERAELVMNTIAGILDEDWLHQVAAKKRSARMTTPAFRHQLVVRAREAGQRIVLPEGDEPRTIRAAAICAERKIAQCILLGDPARIESVARQQGVRLDGVEVRDAPASKERYAEPMVALRKHKGLTTAIALDQLDDTVVLGTMMLSEGEVDGLVSGAVHTTANTIRPALQLIRTAPGASLVSSVFFMCLPEQVLVYGDCAVNPNPSAEQLAEIAVQSADSAIAFGIEPRVAMISYSTGVSGGGEDVDKVAQATALARKARPDLSIDGPLQYDAAAIADVAAKKAPQSPVAGRATVFVFPDLNTGNTTYKAVQRSAGVVSMGPMLQGLKKPVNDLSRGALVEDIVFTIALTAIQAQAGAS